MAASVSQDVQFKFGTFAVPGTPTDRSTYFSSVTFPRAADEVDVTAYGNDGNRSFLPGLKGAEFNSEGFYDATIGAHIDAIYDGQTVVDFEYGPLGDANGMPKYEGTMFCKAFEPGRAVGEANGFTATWRITGAVTLGTYSA
jgi:hypothetical protein